MFFYLQNNVSDECQPLCSHTHMPHTHPMLGASHVRDARWSKTDAAAAGALTTHRATATELHGVTIRRSVAELVQNMVGLYMCKSAQVECS